VPDQTCQAYIATNVPFPSSPPPPSPSMAVCETCHPTNKSHSPGVCEAVPTAQYRLYKVAQYGQVSGGGVKATMTL
jgi:hypothetical protein